MRILQVVDQIGVRFGGSADVVRKLSKELTKLGHDVVVYASDAGVAEGVPDVVNLRCFRTCLTIAKRIRITPSVLFAKFGGFDVIHCHNYYTFQNFAANLRNRSTPMVLSPYGSFVLYDGLIKHKKVQDWFDPVWRWWFLRRFAKVLCCSDVEMKQADRMGLNNATLALIGVDLDDFGDLPPYGEFRRKRGIPEGDKVILYMGRLHWIKGPDILREAFRRFRGQQVRLIVVGPYDGYDFELSGKMQRYDLLSGRAKLEAYVDADVYVVPSRFDAFPLTVVEALACGTPVLMTNKCGLGDYISGLPGMFDLPSPEPEELADGIDLILRTNAREHHREDRMELAKRFSWDKVIKNIEAVYKEVAR